MSQFVAEIRRSAKSTRVKMLTVRQIAEHLGITPACVYESLLYNGKLPYVRVTPRNIRIDPKVFQRFLLSKSYGR